MVIPKIYYQYELAHFKGNMGHNATSDVDSTCFGLFRYAHRARVMFSI
jgi:hypothetical protein